MKYRYLTINSILIFVSIIMLLNFCSDDENNDTKYSTVDLEGVWSGDINIVFHGGDNNGLDTVYASQFTFGAVGNMLSMTPSPDFMTIEGNLSVDDDGKISGIITTTHLENDLLNTETTKMNWSGSTFESKNKIELDMQWTWESTATSEGYYVIAGNLSKQ